jgi:hypothetical protein
MKTIDVARGQQSQSGSSPTADSPLSNDAASFASRTQSWSSATASNSGSMSQAAPTFVTMLLNEGNADPSFEGKYDYNNVKGWSKNVPGKSIFKLGKIFIPINIGQMHWVCAMVK